MFNEAPYAAQVAKHLGTDHTELYVTAKEAQDVIPLLPQLYDEPFGDSSQIPTYLVSKLARTAVTVSLSGDGGDELFGGYERYGWGNKIKSFIEPMPYSLRRGLASSMRALSPELWNTICGPGVRALKMKNAARFGHRVHRVAEVLDLPGRSDLYRLLMTHWSEPPLSRPTSRSQILSEDPSVWPKDGDFRRQMMVADMLTYLPDDIMTKVDRASMGVSLECRAPFLDHKLAEFALSIPSSHHMRNGKGKSLIRSVLYKYVPKDLIERPKAGFAVPIDSWLRGPLRDWAENLLDEKALAADGFFDAKVIRETWEKFLTQNARWDQLLWDVLMFQAWKNI